MTNYRLADTQAQWFQDNFPGSDLTLNENTTVVVLHTTESSGWPGYEGGATAPNYTAKPNFPLRRLAWRAHFPDEKSSRALRNLSGGVETNTLNAIQVELVGTCDPRHRVQWAGAPHLKAGRDYIFWPEAPDWALRALAHFLADMHKRHGLRLRAPRFIPYPSSFGATATRFTFSEWRNFTGVCGHEHVPENSHGDPGDIDIQKVLDMADKLVNPPTLRLVAANMRGGVKIHRNARVKSLARVRPAVAFLSEANGLMDELHKAFPDYKIIGRGKAKAKDEVKLVVGPKVRIVESGQFMVSAHVPSDHGISNERWVTWAKAKYRGHRVLLVAVHLNAAVQTKRGGPKRSSIKRVVEYRKSIQAIERFCRENPGWDPIIGGDVNWKRKLRFLNWFFAPDRMFARLQLHSIGKKTLDRLAVTRELDVRKQWFKKDAPGADHWWVMADTEKPE